MELQVGKKYITRDGRVAVLERHYADREYPFIGYTQDFPLQTKSWKADGRYLGPSETSTADLVDYLDRAELANRDARIAVLEAALTTARNELISRCAFGAADECDAVLKQGR